MQGKYLITTDSWFLAPDGKQYKGVWGDIEILGDYMAMGIKTNRGRVYFVLLSQFYFCLVYQTLVPLLSGL